MAANYGSPDLVHPWVQTLLSSPVESVASLLRGDAPVYPYTRAEPPDAARLMFRGLPPSDPAITALSLGITGLLSRVRSEEIPSNPNVLQDLARQVAESFEIVAALQLPDAALTLRREYIRWTDWSARLIIAPSRDPRAAYWRMLANTQVLLAERVAMPDALAPLWLSLCKGAGRDFPDTYLQIGLLGLRRLPEQIAKGGAPWLGGLASWAQAHQPSPHEFMKTWRPLKRLYPTSPRVIRKQVNAVLAQKTYLDSGIEPPGWWASDPDFPKAFKDKPAAGLEPPPRELLHSLLDELRAGVPYPKVRGSLQALVSGHRRYAELTGDAGYLVRTFSNIATQLIHFGEDARRERSEFAEMLAREAIGYQPSDAIAWGLWRDALLAADDLDSAIELGWDIIRRFPENPRGYGRLGEILAKHGGHFEEAELLFREAIETFPFNPAARNQLAELLIAIDRTVEAEKTVQGAIEEGVVDSYTYAILARLKSSRNDIEGAKHALEQSFKLDAHQPGFAAALAKLERGQQLSLISEGYLEQRKWQRSPTEDAGREFVMRDGRLRSLRNRIGRDEDARKLLQDLLQEDPSFSYAELLAARVGLWSGRVDALPSVGAAFELALAARDQARLSEVAEIAPRHRTLVQLALAYLGNQDAQSAVLKSADFDTEDQAIQTLQVRLKLSENKSVFEGEGAMASSRPERMLRVIYDINEALSAVAPIAA